jgi:hypothetical protein
MIPQLAEYLGTFGPGIVASVLAAMVVWLLRGVFTAIGRAVLWLLRSLWSATLNAIKWRIGWY